MALGGILAKVRVTTKRNVLHWLSQGISPRRLALTLAVGFAVGCIPLVGIPTLLCTGLAMALRLNLPAIQMANYVAMPLQLALIVPFVRLGRWLLPQHNGTAFDPRILLHLPVLHLAGWMGSLAGKALLAWLLVATPAVALMTFALTHMLRRIPALNPTGD